MKGVMAPTEQRQLAASIDSLIRWRKIADAIDKRRIRSNSARLIDYRIVQRIRDEITREIMRIEGVLGDNGAKVRSIVSGTCPAQSTRRFIRYWVMDNATPPAEPDIE